MSDIRIAFFDEPTAHLDDERRDNLAEQITQIKGRRRTGIPPLAVRGGRNLTREVDLALRRQRSAEARASGQNLRSAVEATVRSIKHPFANGKVPVRGQPRASMVMLASATMSNLRRIHRYLVEKAAQEAEKSSQRGTSNDAGESGSSLFGSLRRQVQSLLRLLTLSQPARASGVR